MTAIAKPETLVFDTAPEELRPVLESLVEAVQRSEEHTSELQSLSSIS